MASPLWLMAKVPRTRRCKRSRRGQTSLRRRCFCRRRKAKQTIRFAPLHPGARCYSLGTRRSAVVRVMDLRWWQTADGRQGQAGMRRRYRRHRCKQRRPGVRGAEDNIAPLPPEKLEAIASLLCLASDRILRTAQLANGPVGQVLELASAADVLAADAQMRSTPSTILVGDAAPGHGLPARSNPPARRWKMRSASPLRDRDCVRYSGLSIS